MKKIFFQIVIGWIAFVCASRESFGHSVSWGDLVLSLTGESESVRANGIKKLKQIPNLEKILKQELGGKNKELALDCISALELSRFIPNILEKLEADETGSSIFVIDNISSSQEWLPIEVVLKKLIFKTDSSTKLHPCVRLAIIEAFSRRHTDLSRGELLQLFDPSWPEIQLGVINYLRENYKIKNGLKLNLANLLEEFSKSASPQNHIALEFFAGEVQRSSLKNFNLHLIPSSCTPRNFLTPTCFKNLEVDPPIMIAYGYKDASPSRFVGDVYERLNLVTKILRPCHWKDVGTLCGFERSKFNSDLFVKKEVWSKSLVRQKKGLKEVLIISSSVSSDDLENRSNPFQKFYTAKSKYLFAVGLKKSRMLIYNGHSRAGGGPDFGPPKLTSDHHVAYDWYKKNRPGAQLMKINLKWRARQKIKGSESFTLGLISCHSKEHFHTELIHQRAWLNLVTVPRFIYHSQARDEVSRLLSLSMEPKVY